MFLRLALISLRAVGQPSAAKAAQQSFRIHRSEGWLPDGVLNRSRRLLLVCVFENLEELGYKGFAFLGREVPGVNGLLVGLQVTILGFLCQVPIHQAHYGVDLLAREAISATG